jgi:predicted DNA-binding transcriptional regulator YafY
MVPGDYHAFQMNRVERLTAILLLLQDKPHTSEDIARHFEVSKRTILRDVQALSEMGVPVIAREGAGGGYSLPEDYRLAPLPLSSREAFLLLLALSAINKLSDAPFAQERTSLMAKIQAALPTHQHGDVEQLLSAVSVGMPEREQRAPFLDALLQAVQEKVWVRIEYQSAERRSTQHVFPRRIFAQHGLWYLDAYSHEHEEDRRYRVDRIHYLAPAGTQFSVEPPEPVAYEDESHPQIVAALTPRGMAMVESEPSVAARVQRNDDGSGTFFGRCPPEELSWFSRYLAGLGDEVVVLEPPELRVRLAQLGQQLTRRYQNR